MQQYYFIFLIFNIVCFLQASMTDEELSHLGYRQSREEIKNTSRLFHGWGVESNGHFKISNPIKTNVLTCFAGKHKDCNKKFIKNPLSILDLNKNKDKPYIQIDELNNDIPVSAIHLLAINNKLFPVVGHSKNIYLFTESDDSSILPKKNQEGLFFSVTINEARHILTKITTISPQLLDNDTIHTIDSCKSHLIALSSQGCITTWDIANSAFLINTIKSIHNKEPFFSCAINQQEKTIYLGLNDGKIFVASIPNLTDNAIISLFSGGKINWINSCADKILFCALCDCYTHTSNIQDCMCNCNHDDKGTSTCTNEHILLLASHITPTNNTNLQGTSFLDKDDFCPKAIYLLENGTAIVRRTICRKNDSSITEIEDCKEDVALISTNKITPIPQAVHTAYLYSTFLKYFGGYPMHIIPQENNNFSIIGESPHSTCYTRKLEVNTSFFLEKI